MVMKLIGQTLTMMKLRKKLKIRVSPERDELGARGMQPKNQSGSGAQLVRVNQTSPKAQPGLGNTVSDASIQYYDQTGGNSRGDPSRQPKLDVQRGAQVAMIPKNLIRIVRSKSPSGGDLSDDLSPPQETRSKITIPPASRQKDIMANV